MAISKLLNKHGANVLTDNLGRLCAHLECGIEAPLPRERFKDALT